MCAEPPQRGGQRKRVADLVPYGFCGLMLVASFAFAGHYMGQNAVARSIPQEDMSLDLVSPPATLVAKGSLLPSEIELNLVSLPLALEQEVQASLKSDMTDPSFDDPPPVESTPKQQRIVKKLSISPPIWKLESTFKMKRQEKKKVIAQRRVKVAEENCLARAIYFEARSESELGQLAVAKVILNRTRSPDFPKSICGVVYQGSDRRNSCQFSFACDGMPDDIRNKQAWSRSKRVAQKALAGDQSIRVIGAATNYHADYVKPRWSRSMKRLVKIGRHIFYQDS